MRNIFKSFIHELKAWRNLSVPHPEKPASTELNELELTDVERAIVRSFNEEWDKWYEDNIDGTITHKWRGILLKREIEGGKYVLNVVGTKIYLNSYVATLYTQRKLEEIGKQIEKQEAAEEENLRRSLAFPPSLL
jgi:hypothetical protein